MPLIDFRLTPARCTAGDEVVPSRHTHTVCLLVFVLGLLTIMWRYMVDTIVLTQYTVAPGTLHRCPSPRTCDACPVGDERHFPPSTFQTIFKLD